MSSEYLVFRGIVRNYRSHPVRDAQETVHCPYQGQLHTLDDEHVSPDRLLDGVTVPMPEWWTMPYGRCPIPENRVVEIIVRITDEHAPLGEDPWVLQLPHVYGPNSQIKPNDLRREGTPSFQPDGDTGHGD